MNDEDSNSNTRKTNGNIILIDDSLDYTSNKTELDIELETNKKNPKYLKYNIESSAETTVLNMDEFLDERKSNISDISNKKINKKNIKKKFPVEISLIEDKNKKVKKKSKKAGEEEYEVEKIIDKKLQAKKVYYKVKWVGYRDDECTWEPIENLKGALFYVEDYEKRQLNKHNENLLDKKKTKPYNGLSLNLIEEDNSKAKKKNANDSKFNTISSNKNSKISKVLKEKSNNSLVNKKDKNISYVNGNSLKEKSQTKAKDTIIKSPVKSKNIKVSIVDNQYEEEGIPDKIISAYKDKKDELYYVLRWKENHDGSRMKNKDFKGSEIKKKYPDIVFEFLESKIKFKAS